MAQQFEITLTYNNQQITLLIVSVGNSFIVYKEKQACAALHKKGTGWEELLFEPSPEELLQGITANLDRQIVN